MMKIIRHVETDIIKAICVMSLSVPAAGEAVKKKHTESSIQPFCTHHGSNMFHILLTTHTYNWKHLS